jgi:hypothetical protein
MIPWFCRSLVVLRTPRDKRHHGEFNMVFNSIINWNDVPAKK